MTKTICILLTLVAIVTGMKAQQPAAWEPLAVYQEAVELFDKQKFGAAEEKFSVLLHRLESPQPGENRSGLGTDAEFYIAACAFNLLRNNAASLLEEFIFRHPSHVKVNDARYYISKLHFIKKEFKEAIPYLEDLEWKRLDNEYASDARFMLGWCYYSAGEKDKAAGIFRIAKSIRGDKQTISQYYYSLIRYEKGDYAEALDGLETLKSTNQKFADDIPVILANCYLKLGKTTELEALLGEIQSSGKAPGPDFYAVIANAFFESGDFVKAEQNFALFTKAHGQLDRNGEYRYAYSLYKNNHLTEAKPHFEKCLRPEDGMAQSAHYYLGHCFLKMENFENARLAFGKAYKITGNAKLSEDALYQYAKISFTTRYFEDALVAFQDLILTYPGSEHVGEARALLGEIMLYSAKYKDALDFFEKSPLKNERSIKAFQQASFSYASEMYSKNLFGKAAEYFKKAFNLKADPALTLNAYFWYAESLFRMEDYSNATGYYMTFLDQAGSSKSEYYGKANYGIAWSYFREKNYDQASKYFAKFIALAGKKENPEIYVDAFLRAGDAEFIRKKYPEALNYYSQVRDFNDRQADYAFYQLGQCYQRSAEYKKATDNFGVVVERYRKSDYRARSLMRMADIYGGFLQDWKNCGKYSRMLIDEYPRDPLIPEAYNLAASAAANEGDKPKAIQYFKTVVLEFGGEKDHALRALDNLSAMLPGKEYDQLMIQYRAKYPDSGGQQLCGISYRTGYERYAEDNFSSAISLLSDFISTCQGDDNFLNALYYRAVSYEKSENPSSALLDYERVYSHTPIHPKAEEALLKASEILFKQKSYMSSLQLFNNLEEITSKIENRMKARFGRAKNYMAMEDYKLAMEAFLAIHSDPNTTQFSRDKSYVQIGVCKYYLGQKAEANSIFSEIEKKQKNEFGAESQYMITRILYDNKKYDESITAGLYLKDNYSTQHYWKARTFLILVEDFLGTGDTLAATANLEKLAQETRFPDVMEQAKKRLREIEALIGQAKMEDGQ